MKWKKILSIGLSACVLFSALQVSCLTENTVKAASDSYYYYDLGNYLQTNPKCFYPAGSLESTPSGRYIKLNVNTPNQGETDLTVRINEFELNYDIALGKTAAATDSNSGTETAAQAVDGDITTHWCSTLSGSRYLTVDLGSAKTIKKWIVRNAQANGESASYNTKAYKLQVSTDNSNFTDVDTVSDNSAASTERLLPGATGRYFRLYITTPNQIAGNNVIRINSFELYEQDNLLTSNAGVTAVDANSNGETPDKALDGSLTTHWCSTSSANEKWMKVYLGSVKYFNRWVIKNAGAGGESGSYNTVSCSLSSSNDNTIFTGADSFDNNTANIVDRTIVKKTMTAYAYDYMKMVAAAQGIINRDGPLLYVKFYASDEIAKPRGFDPDTFWLGQLTQSGNILSGKTKITVSDFYADFLKPFQSKFSGLVLWDENVPSTSNVAATVAGVENLLPVRYDTSAASLFTELHNQLPGFLAVKDLSGKFTGTGTIWGTSISSTGSKKCDAYLWAKVNYIDTGKVNSTLMQYAVDAWTKDRDTSGKMMYTDDFFNRMVINQDYYIMNKAFFFDLAPGGTNVPSGSYLPNDDPTQPLGTDNATLETILSAMYTKAGGNIITIGGFAPWHIKYTDQAYYGGMSAIDSEWGFVKAASKYNAQLDADAPGIMGLANASVYSQVPLDTLVQKNSKGTDNYEAYSPDTRYVLLYMGDFDSAAWSAGELPALWNKANGRGRIPLTWSVVPNLSQRVPNVYNYLYATATSKDYFVSGDNGAGYQNPMYLPTASLDNWQSYSKSWFNRLDLDIAGFVITDYISNLANSIQSRYTEFAPDGVFVNNGYDSAYVNGTPFLKLVDLNYGHTPKNKSYVEKGLNDYISSNPDQHFYAFRTILADPDILADGVAQYQADHSNMNLKVVDPYTFLRLYREYKGYGNTYLRTGLESGQSQPAWPDSIDNNNALNISGYLPGVSPECSVRSNETSHSGTSSLMVAGTDNSTASSYCYYKVFDVDIPVTSDMRLNYWINPQNENGRYVSVDLICTDGTTLRDSGALDQKGNSMHPSAPKGTVNQWNQERCDIGKWLKGKTIDRILIGYDQPASSGQYRAYIDDISILR